MKKKQPKRKQKPVIEALEPRILFSADVFGGAIDPFAATDPLEDQLQKPSAIPVHLSIDEVVAVSESQDQVAPLVSPVNQSRPSELVIVDTVTHDYQLLVDDILAQSSEEKLIEVVLLDTDHDGISQLNEILSGYSDLDAVHIISHGSSGEISLGTSTLNSEYLAEHVDSINSWGDAFSVDGDLLIYGCNLTANEDGQSMVDSLASLTGADVAASDDLTGHANLGGDWDLEYVAGNLETAVALSVELQESYEAVLGVTSVSFQEGVNGYTGTQDTDIDNTIPASNNGANTVIEIDLDDGMGDGTVQGLIQFDSLFGSGAGQIPFGAIINSATLTVNATNVSDSGAQITFHQLLTNWDESSNWGSLSDGISLDDVEAASTADATVPVTDSLGAVTITGLEGALQNWSNGDTNNGWVIISDSDNGWYFSSSEEGNANLRPELTVDYSVPPSNNVPVAQTTNENTALVFSIGNGNPVTISDADAGSDPLEVSLAVTNGTLTLSGTTGLTFISGDGLADATTTFQGTVSDINAALNGMSYMPDANYTGAESLSVTTFDDTTLQSMYSFDDADNLGNDDGVGIAYNGTVTGATAVNDPARGDVLSFDGNDYVQIAGHFGDPANVTLAAWVNLTTPDTNGATVISLGDSVSLRVDEWSGDIVAFYYDGSTWNELKFSTTIASTGWHHVAYTVDDTNNVHKIYLDGTEVASATASTSISYTLGANSYIGTHGDGNTSFDFIGMIDDARIYDRVLSAAEINSLTNNLNAQDTDTVAITVDAVNDAPSFDAPGDGTVIAAIGGGTDYGYSITLQPDGMSLVGGYSWNGSDYDFTVSRYNVDGTLDTTFGGGDGIATIAVGIGSNDQAYEVALQSDGSILLAGSHDNGVNIDFALTRLNSDGTLDTSFGGGDGIVITDIANDNEYARTMAVQADGSIVVAGFSDTGAYNNFAVIRYNSDGSLDTSFDGDGIVTTAVPSYSSHIDDIAIQADGKIVVIGDAQDGSGQDFAIVRYNTNGSLDTTFGGTGIVITALGANTSSPETIAVQADGKIVAGGAYYNGTDYDFAAVRYNTDGTLDTTFGGGDGIATVAVSSNSDTATSLELQADGKIVLSGYSSNGTDNDVAVARLNSDGSVDTTFGGGDGVVTNPVGSGNDYAYGMAIQSDGSILVAGASYIGSNMDTVLQRYTSDGSLDTSFGPVNTLDGNPNYLENGAAVVLDFDVQVFDTELSAADNFNGATLTLVNNAGANSDDVFSPTGTLTALNEGFNLEVDSTVIGTVTTNSNGTLVLTFNSLATNALVNSAMQQIAYSNSSDNPPGSTQIDWTFDDGNTGAQGSGGALSVTGSTTVNIFALNDAPVTNNVSASGNEDATSIAITLTGSDIDGTVDFFQLNGLPANGQLFTDAGLSIAAATATDYAATGETLTLYFVPNANSNGVTTFDFIARDNAGLMDATPATATLTINAVNDAPTLTALSHNPTYTEGGASVGLFGFVEADPVESGQTIDELVFTVSNVTDGSNEIINLDGSTFALTDLASGATATNGYGYSVSLVGSTATVTLTTTGATVANIAILGGSLSYENSSENPTTNNRVFTITSIQDSGGIANGGIDTSSPNLVSTVTVTAANDAPVTGNASTGITEDPVYAQINLNGTDVDGTVTHFSLNDLPANGTLYLDSGLTTVVTAGTDYALGGLLLPMYFVPDTNWTGTTTFSYVAKDDQGVYSAVPATGTITITPVNDAPVINGNNVEPFINEIHYDNTGTDSGEAVEIAGLAGTDLTGWSLVFYNGSGGAVYDTEALSGVIADQGNGYGTVVINMPVNGIQNGPDGIALINDSGQVLEFLSYEGAFVAVDGAAAGMMSTDIGVAETSGTAVGDSIQRVGVGPTGTWTSDLLNTFGSINTGQTLVDDQLAPEIVDEDTPLTFSVANGNAITITDVDADDGSTDPIKISLSVTNGSLTLGSVAGLGTVSGNSTGSIILTGSVAEVNAALDGLIYQGNLNFNGADSLTITVDDQGNTGIGGSLSDTAIVGITVNPINDAPVAVDDAAIGDEGNSVIINLVGNDSDVDNALDLSSIVITTAPGNGSLVDNGDGTLTYTHDGSETVGDSFSYTIADVSGVTSNVATVDVTVNPINDAPVAVDDTASVDEGNSVIINLVGNDSDADNALDLSSIIITGAPANGSLVDNGDGTLTYTHDGSETVTDSFSYTIADVSGTTSNVATVDVTVNPINDAPVAVDDAAIVDEGNSVIINLTGNDSDADNALDLSSIVITSAPGNGALLDNGDGTLTYTHDGSETVADSFSYTINDVSGVTSNIANVALTVNPVNDAPVAVDDVAIVDEGNSVIINLIGNDSDADNALDLSSIIITGAPANGSLVDNGDGTLTYTHDGSETVTDSFSYTIADASGGTSNIANVAVTVNPINDAPVAADDTASVDEGNSVIINLVGNDSDADNALDLNSIVITSAPANGTLVDNGDGTLTYSHNGSETVADSFSYTIADVSGVTSNIANVAVTINPINDAPVAVDDTALVDEGNSVIINLTGNDSDVDNALDLSSIVITTAPGNGSLVDNGDGTLTYTHDSSETVADSFSYTIADESGVTSNVANVAVTVNPINDAPVTADDAASVDEGNSVIINLVGNDSDADNALDLSSIVITSAPGNGSLVDNGDGTLTYTHDGSETVTDSFSYTIADVSGTTSNVATVDVTVNPINDAPVAADDTASVDEGNSVIINLIGNDSDADNALDLSSIIITGAPANGSLVDNGDGTLTYTHDGSETVADSFSYTIADASGVTSNVANVTVTVNPINDAPVAVDDTASVDEGNSVIINLVGNDSDADNALDLSSIIITGAPANGSLVDNGDGTLTYTHDGSETVGDSFSYTIADVSGVTSNIANVAVTVNPINDAPVAADDAAIVDEGNSVIINLVGNDSDADNALDLSSIVITSVPGNGSLVDNGDGTLTYTHDGSETVGDSFSYTINDVSGTTSNVANVAITVNPVNDVPVAVDDAAIVDEGNSVIINLVGNDSDVDNALDLNSIVITSAPANGTLVDNGDGTLTYSHNGSETVADSFSYTIADVSGVTSNVANVAVTINPINDAPVADNDAAIVDEGNSVIINLAGNDSDVDNALDLSRIVITSAPGNGSLVDNGDGTFTYTHDGSETVADSFSYTIADVSGVTSNVATVDVTVNPINDAPVAADDAASVDEGNSVIINQIGNDSDVDNALDLSSIVITTAPGNGSLVDNGDGTLTYTHDSSETVADSFSYTIADVSGVTSNVANVAVTVNPINDAPVAADDAASVDEGNSVIINLVSNDSDADNALDLSSIVITSAPGNGTLLDNGDGTLTYTHDGSETVADSFSYTINDVSGVTSNIANVVVTVNPINDAPVAVADVAIVDEGNSVIINLVSNDSDADNALDLSSIVITSAPGNGSLVDNGDGTLTYTHDGSETVGDSFSYTINDVSGTPSNTANVAITVNPINDAPVAADDAASVDEGNSVIINLVGNDSDADNALDLSSIVITSAPGNGSLVDNGDGTFTYTHDGSETVADSFSYTIADISGTTSNVATVDVTVNPINDAPVAVDDMASVDEGNSVIINLIGNDSDADNALDLSSIIITGAPANGSLVDNGDGTLTYTHDGSETVADSFSYTIADVSGVTSNVANVAVTVNPINDAPVADNDAAIVDEGNSVIINLIGNDSDVDNALDLSSIVITTAPGNGSLVDNGDGTFTYTHDGSETVADSFSYTIADVTGVTSNVANVAVTVNPINDAPVAVDDVAIVDEGNSVIINLIGNDSDADNALDLSSIVITSAPGNGSLVDNGDGTLTYTHDGSETVGDSFGYTINDVSGTPSNASNIAITVNPINDAPVAVADAAIVDEGNSVIINLAGNDSDADNALDLSSIVITSAPGNGSLVDNGDGTLTYIHDGNGSAVDGFSYSINDTSGTTSNVVNVTISVTPRLVVGTTPILNDNEPEELDDPIEDLVVIPNLGDINPEIKLPVAETQLTESEESDSTGEAGMSRPASINMMDFEMDDMVLASVIEDMQSPTKNKSESTVPSKFLDLREIQLKPIDLAELTPFELNSVLDNELFIKGLDDMSHDLDNAAQQLQSSDKVTTDIVIGVVMSVSAGFVSWILRAGTLMASFMSVAPIWMHLDPVPVLGKSNKKDESENEDESSTSTEDDEKVEELFKQ